MKEIFGIKVDDKKFSELIYEQSQGKDLIVQNGEVIAVEHQQTREEFVEQMILNFKQKLKDTDYQAIKYAEGELTEEEYAPIKAQRKEWRVEINRLEEELKNGESR
jgi:hypothetical protein